MARLIIEDLIDLLEDPADIVQHPNDVLLTHAGILGELRGQLGHHKEDVLGMAGTSK